MAEPITITLTFSYDPDLHGGMAGNQFLYHLISRLNSECPIIAVEYKGETKEFTEEQTLADLPLRFADSIDEKDVPKPPKFTKLIPHPQTKELTGKNTPTPLEF